MSSRKPAAAALALLLAACHGHGGSGDGSEIRDEPGTAFDAVRAEETLRFTGTEPFWGGTVTGDRLVWQTPEDQQGTEIPVRRFAGNHGLGFSGTLAGQGFDMAVTPGACSDGMSDRTYPFTVTVTIGQAMRSGCAWTDRRPFTGPPGATGAP